MVPAAVVNAAITALGGRVPIALDVVASLLAKFQPISDALHLHHVKTAVADSTSPALPSDERARPHGGLKSLLHAACLPLRCCPAS